jgi:hypothetical protein
VFFNGLGIYLLSMVAISSYRRAQQILWALIVIAVSLWSEAINARVFQYDVRAVLHYDVLHYASPDMKQLALRLVQNISPTAGARYLTATFDDERSLGLAKLQAIVGEDPVATPYMVNLGVEEQLKRSGQYRPSFYWYYVGVLDYAAETRRINEFNQSKWALIPTGARETLSETPDALVHVAGFALPYRSKRQPYVAGERFYDNLRANWQPAGEVDGYTVYRHR